MRMVVLCSLNHVPATDTAILPHRQVPTMSSAELSERPVHGVLQK